MTTKVLYVCTYWGVRSQIALLLTEALNQQDIIADSAGFESGMIGDLPRQLMAERGLELARQSPDTLFKYARNSAEYDYVVTLCNQYTQENYTVLYNVVDMLFSEHAQIIHWNVPDFMSITETGEARKAAGQDIIAMIESEVHDFVKQVQQR